MIVLAFDTATAATAVALDEIEARDDPPAAGRPGHARRLLSLIDEVMDRGGKQWRDVDRLAVGLGPGTFTGLRIGLASAQALSRSTGIPLVGVPTLTSLAMPATEAHRTATVLAVIDARRGEAFAAGFSVDGGLVLEPSVLTPAALQDATRRLGDVSGKQATDGVIAIGDGALKFRDALEHAGAHVPPDDSPLHRVSARHHCRLAQTAQPGTVEPMYLRLPDAELALR